MSEQPNLEMCKISICTTTALENGYCNEHKNFYESTSALSSRSDTQPRTSLSWFSFLSVSALLLFLAGVIYGLYNFNILNEYSGEYANELFTQAKIRSIIIPIFVTGTVSLILLALGKIIDLIDKKT
jgi:hypothetical protein